MNIEKIHILCLVGDDRGLYQACKAGNIALVNLAIRNGSSNWNIGLKGASKNGSSDLIDFMLSKGADDINIILYEACKKGNIESVITIIKKYNNYDFDWINCSYGASKSGSLELIELMNNKQKNKFFCIPWGFSKRFAFCSMCKKGNLNLAKRFLDNIDIETLNLCLRFASKAGFLNVVNFLIDKGATDYSYALEGACEGGYLDIYNLMVTKCNMDSLNSCLYNACKGNNLNIVKLLILKGVTNYYSGIISVCVSNKETNTSIEIIKLLIKLLIKKATYNINYDHIFYNSISSSNFKIAKFIFKIAADSIDLTRCYLKVQVRNYKKYILLDIINNKLHCNLDTCYQLLNIINLYTLR